MGLEAIRQEMRDRGVECVIITDPANFAYTLGEEASGYLFVTEQDVDLVVSNFYRYGLEGYDPEYVQTGKGYEDALEDRKDRCPGSVVADADPRGVLEDKFGAEESDLVAEARCVKTGEEVDRIREACHIADDALLNLEEKLFSGITEWDALSELQQFYAGQKVTEAFLTEKGNSLVQANTVRPHRLPEDRVIQEDDMVVVDTGARHGYYCSDVTRTYCRSPSEEQLELFESVKKMQEELIGMVEPGRAVERVAERQLEMAEELGYDRGENVLHSPGHGIGVETHEKPSIKVGGGNEFREGMVVTVEPGLYVPGLGGCRIEDTVLVTSKGAERLSGSPTQLS